jgi:hypothetical protein
MVVGRRSRWDRRMVITSMKRDDLEGPPCLNRLVPETDIQNLPVDLAFSQMMQDHLDDNYRADRNSLSGCDCTTKHIRP